jgi:hypothetical protein
MRLAANGGMVLETADDITAITKARNAQVTPPFTATAVGDQIYFNGVLGMTEINGLTGTVLRRSRRQQLHRRHRHDRLFDLHRATRGGMYATPEPPASPPTPPTVPPPSRRLHLPRRAVAADMFLDRDGGFRAGGLHVNPMSGRASIAWARPTTAPNWPSSITSSRPTRCTSRTSTTRRASLPEPATPSWTFSTITFAPAWIAGSSGGVATWRRRRTPTRQQRRGLFPEDARYVVTAVDDDTGRKAALSIVTATTPQPRQELQHDLMGAVTGAERYRVYKADVTAISAISARPTS